MLYKTMILGLLQDRPQLYDHLISNRTLLATLDSHAKELKVSHEAWKDRLWQARPDSDASQINSEAMELALEELERVLPPASLPDEDSPFSLDAAMRTFIIRSPCKSTSATS